MISHDISCFLFYFNGMVNSVDLNQTAPFGLHCLLRPLYPNNIYSWFSARLLDSYGKNPKKPSGWCNCDEDSSHFCMRISCMSQLTHNVASTSPRRHGVAATSERCCFDVVCFLGGDVCH